MSGEPNTFYSDQFNNRDAINGYRGIGTELLAQAGNIDAFCGGVGTAGMSPASPRRSRAPDAASSPSSPTARRC